MAGNWQPSPTLHVGPEDYGDVAGVWSGTPDYGAEAPVVGESKSLFSPDYAPEEIYEIAAKLMKSGGISPKQPGDGEHARAQKGPSDSPGRGKQSSQ